VPLARAGSRAEVVAVLGGMPLTIAGLTGIGVVRFGVGTRLALVTAPVEFDAGRRATAALTARGLVTREEVGDRAAPLGAARRTAAGFASVLLARLYLLVRVAGMARSSE
jgi:Zn-dependent membrane protease YugP